MFKLDTLATDMRAAVREYALVEDVNLDGARWTPTSPSEDGEARVMVFVVGDATLRITRLHSDRGCEVEEA